MNSMDIVPALIRVMKVHPDLTLDGLAGDKRANFKQRRAELLGASDQFAKAVAWLEQVPPRKTPNERDGHSYYVKHAAENWAGGYVSNGALIAAGLYLRFPWRQCPSSVNIWLGVASRRKWPSADKS